MDCSFCSIFNGTEDATILDRRDETIAFAPLNPVSKGHILVAPTEHFKSVFDIPDPVLADVFTHAKTIAESLCADEYDGVNILNANGPAAQQSVLHFHIHLVPRRADDDIDLWPDTEYEESDFEQTYERVRRVLEDSN